MKPGERVELTLEKGDTPIALRVVKDEADGWVAVTTEMEYEYARMQGRDPEPLVRVRSEQLQASDD
ncbi:MAG: hypothetical protein JO165_11910 [Candidatus Eremiobacteraeota bacterium]|nr:hypothetical protein [Candidatus Eremiobacteraeota bacterium]